MRFHIFHCLAAALAVLGFAVFSSSAVVHYVDINGTNATAPYTNWLMAATNIQDAVDASATGDSVLVTNGVYATGGRNWFGSGTNRVTLTNAVTLQSVNGPAVTMIVGARAVGTSLTTATRCVGMGNNAVLSGFTLTNGEAGGGNYPAGGGVANLTFGNSMVTNCILTGNLATNNVGGGAYRVTLINCRLIGNYAGSGGGACACTLANCLVVSNTASASGGLSASKGGGVYGDSTVGASSLTNCTIVGNSAVGSGGGVNNSGIGAMDNCIVYYNTAPTGSNYANIKINNCCTLPILTGDIGSSSNAPAFMDLANGNYHLQFGSPCINAGANTFAPAGLDLDGNPRSVGAAVDMGAYENQNTNPVHFVSLSTPVPVSPFTNWMTAATNIQDAIDVSVAGDLVVVSNGIYNVGGRAVYGTATNRVTVNKAVTVQSLNGTASTIIAGAFVHGGEATRCAYLTNGAMLIGFTLTNGGLYSLGDFSREQSGGGVWCESSSAVISNCVLSGNYAPRYGGGAFQGTLFNCILANNSAAFNGGGTCSNALYDCILKNNLATSSGGGAYGGVLVNSTVVSNTAGNGVTSGTGGGIYNAGASNCIVYYNLAESGKNFNIGALSYCDTFPLATGFGNISNAPVFVDLVNNDFHLQSNSPCINAGNNSYIAISTDLDGNRRITGGTVDIGAYEFQTPSSLVSYAYLQQYNLPTDGSADYLDSDGDGLNNWQEWNCGTNPTNAASVLKVLAPPATGNASGIVITWQSVSGKTYYITRSSDLSAQPPVSIIQSNILGLNGTTSFTDTKATNSVPYFYRVGVQ